MRPPFYPSIVRIGVRPDQPDEVPAAVCRPPGRRWRPQRTAAEVAAVRRLIEQTTLSHRLIAKRTGVSVANISRWTRQGDWQRSPFAPRASDTVPTARASARLKRRMLAARLDALAERHVRELEASVPVDPDKLAEALELLKMARLAASKRWRRLDPGNAKASPTRGEPLRPIIELCASGVDLQRAPRAAVEDFLEHREPPRMKPPRHRGGRRSRRDREHAWMMAKDQDVES